MSEPRSTFTHIRISIVHVLTVLTLAFAGLLGLMYQEIRDLRNKTDIAYATAFQITAENIIRSEEK